MCGSDRFGRYVKKNSKKWAWKFWAVCSFDLYTDRATTTRLLILIKNIDTLYGRERLLHTFQQI